MRERSSLLTSALRYPRRTTSHPRRRDKKKGAKSQSHVFICPSEARLITASQANNCKLEFCRRLEPNLNATVAHNELCNHNATLAASAIILRENTFHLDDHGTLLPAECSLGSKSFATLSAGHIVSIGISRRYQELARVPGTKISMSPSKLPATGVPNVTLFSVFPGRRQLADSGADSAIATGNKLRNRHLPREHPRPHESVTE